MLSWREGGRRDAGDKCSGGKSLEIRKWGNREIRGRGKAEKGVIGSVRWNWMDISSLTSSVSDLLAASVLSQGKIVQFCVGAYICSDQWMD